MWAKIRFVLKKHNKIQPRFGPLINGEVSLDKMLNNKYYDSY
jgi:hypothetical protein